MKLFQLVILFVFVVGLAFVVSNDALAALDPYRSRCVGIQGKFTATNWSGGPIQVGCGGDDGLAVSDPSQKCTGEIQTIRPGETYRLTKCSCFGTDKGCLKKGKELKFLPVDVNGYKKVRIVSRIADMNVFKNNSCTVTKTANVCGSNGQRISKNIVIACEAKSLVTTSTPAPPEAITSPTPTPTLPPGVSPTPPYCPLPTKVENVKIDCPNCNEVIPTPTDQPTN